MKDTAGREIETGDVVISKLTTGLYRVIDMYGDIIKLEDMEYRHMTFATTTGHLFTIIKKGASVYA